MPADPKPLATAAARVGWFVLHLAVVIAPLGIAAIEAPPGRGLLVDLSVALGFVALSLFGIQFILAARWTPITAPFGVDMVLRYHRQLALLSSGAAFAHPLMLLAHSTMYAPLLDVFHSPLRAKLAVISVLALTLLILTSVFRRALNLPYTTWHVLHSTLAVTIVATALGHAVLVGYYMSTPAMRILWGIYAAALTWLLIWTRLIKPMRLHRRPWCVVELWPEPGDCLTVALRPTGRAEGQLTGFAPGQFAWILTGKTPFTLTYHPFSVSSSAERDVLEFTVKTGGDFTRSLRRLQIGSTVYVDGPHGSFTPDRHPGMGYVFLATGVGVTPFLSMLSTMADRRDHRPVWLFLGNRHESQVVGIRQLNRIAGRVNLTTIHAISNPSEHWTGERGRLTTDLLRRHLPHGHRHLHYFICSSPEVTHTLENQLRDLDVPEDRIHAERFSMV